MLGREVPVAELVAGIDQLDADGAGVDVPLAGPAGHAGVPGAPVLGHQLEDPTVLLDHVVGAHLGGGVAETLQRRLARLHAGVMKQQHVDRLVAACVVVRRGTIDKTKR